MQNWREFTWIVWSKFSSYYTGTTTKPAFGFFSSRVWVSLSPRFLFFGNFLIRGRSKEYLATNLITNLRPTFLKFIKTLRRVFLTPYGLSGPFRLFPIIRILISNYKSKSYYFPQNQHNQIVIVIIVIIGIFFTTQPQLQFHWFLLFFLSKNYRQPVHPNISFSKLQPWEVVSTGRGESTGSCQWWGWKVNRFFLIGPKLSITSLGEPGGGGVFFSFISQNKTSFHYWFQNTFVSRTIHPPSGPEATDHRGRVPIPPEGCVRPDLDCAAAVSRWGNCLGNHIPHGSPNLLQKIHFQNTGLWPVQSRRKHKIIDFPSFPFFSLRKNVREADSILISILNVVQPLLRIQVL